MKVVVTGSAGFIGSTLFERLVKDGHSVLGIDCLTDYYDIDLKQRNLADTNQGSHNWQALDLTSRGALHTVLDGFSPDVIVHLAGNPGVRNSWGNGFDAYLNRNILATQSILDWLAANTETILLNASTSSVYGEIIGVATEDQVPAPRSPYGLSKLAVEQLVQTYRIQFGIQCASLRFFSVYGPRQRPDMAFTKLMNCISKDEAFPVYGTGEQLRDFTYVDDVVDGLVSLVNSGKGALIHDCYNIASGRTISLNDCIEILASHLGKNLKLEYFPAVNGDVMRTSGSNQRLREITPWVPGFDVEQGIINQWEWFQTLLGGN